MAQMIIFPMTKRIGSIRRLARSIADYDDKATVERILRKPLEQMYTALLRKGLPSPEAKKEMRKFRTAIAMEAHRMQQVTCCYDDDDGDAA